MASARRANLNAVIGVIMGSGSDRPTLQPAIDLLEKSGVPFEVRVVSAHRTPRLLWEYAGSAERRGLQCIIAAAGGAAHLPGMAAALTTLPVLGVPARSRSLRGLDSLLSIAQMPYGVPVATFRVGPAGAQDAARFALQLIRPPAPRRSGPKRRRGSPPAAGSRPPAR